MTSFSRPDRKSCSVVCFLVDCQSEWNFFRILDYFRTNSEFDEKN